MADKKYRLGIVIEAQDKLTKNIARMDKAAKKLDKTKISPTARLNDKLSGPAAKIESRLKSLSRKTISVTVKAKDMASSVISKITSPLALLGAGAGVYGLGKMTLGSAMDFETQMVSMEHWLKGNKEVANQYVSWLDQLAAKTPFEMGDLFPAASRAVGISEGDVNLAERMVKLSSDMAGLTPGKSVQDAMEALADAQTGEYERLKEFNIKMTQDEMKKLGNFSAFLGSMETKFGGGADALSQTATGRLSTITDTIKTMFRSAGQGMLQAIKPRLDKIGEWFDKNQDKIQEWKQKLITFGQEAFEGLLSWGETVMQKLEARINTPEFQSMTWSQKLETLIGDVFEYIMPIAERAAVKLGKLIVEGLMGGIVSAMQSNPLVAMIIGGMIGGQIGGVYGGIAGAVGGIGVWGVSKLAGGSNSENPSLVTTPSTARSTSYGTTLPGATASEMDRFTKKAAGDIVTRPTLSLIGEAGPEAIIPLSSRMRSRAMHLWQQTGQALGVRPYAVGGFAGAVPAGGGEGYINVKSYNNITWGPDEDALALQIGRKIVADIKQAMQNKG